MCRKVLLYYFFIILSQIELEKLFLIRAEILGLLVNMLTAKYADSRINGENLLLPIQIKLFKER